MTDININVTVRLSEGLEKQIERLLELLTTATYLYEEEEEDDD